MRNKRPLKFYKFTAGNIIFGLLALSFVGFLFLWDKTPSVSSALPVKFPSGVSSAYKELFLSARAVYVLDGGTGTALYSKNGDAQLPLASLTKIMMAVTALSLVPENTVITISPSFISREGNSGFFHNERWELRDLLSLTLLESSNDGADAIAATTGQASLPKSGIGGQAAVASSSIGERVPYDLGIRGFVDAMNKKAVELNLAQSYFLNPTGLDESDYLSGGYGSARDIAVLFSYAETKYPRLFEATRYDTRDFTSLNSVEHKVKNTNMFVSSIPSLLGSKTGFTDLAGGNLVISFDAGPNHPVIISVLGSTEKGRFEDAEKLVWATLEYLQTNN